MVDLYAGKDPRHVPSYSVAEAAHYLNIAGSTLRSWLLGRRYPTASGEGSFEPLIRPPSRSPLMLSFLNVVEAHVLAAIRTTHRVPLTNVRSAIDHVRDRCGIERPLADASFKTDGLALFIEELGHLVNASLYGQEAIREVMDARLERVEHDEQGLAARLFPFTRHGAESTTQPRTVVIDPRVAFGRPILFGTGIPTAILSDRYKAGESMTDLADDYDCERDMIEEAIRCELAA